MQVGSAVFLTALTTIPMCMWKSCPQSSVSLFSFDKDFEVAAPIDHIMDGQLDEAPEVDAPTGIVAGSVWNAHRYLIVSVLVLLELLAMPLVVRITVARCCQGDKLKPLVTRLFPSPALAKAGKYDSNLDRVPKQLEHIEDYDRALVEQRVLLSNSKKLAAAEAATNAAEKMAAAEAAARKEGEEKAAREAAETRAAKEKAAAKAAAKNAVQEKKVAEETAKREAEEKAAREAAAKKAAEKANAEAAQKTAKAEAAAKKAAEEEAARKDAADKAVAEAAAKKEAEEAAAKKAAEAKAVAEAAEAARLKAAREASTPRAAAEKDCDHSFAERRLLLRNAAAEAAAKAVEKRAVAEAAARKEGEEKAAREAAERNAAKEKAAAEAAANKAAQEKRAAEETAEKEAEEKAAREAAAKKAEEKANAEAAQKKAKAEAAAKKAAEEEAVSKAAADKAAAEAAAKKKTEEAAAKKAAEAKAAAEAAEAARLKAAEEEAAVRAASEKAQIRKRRRFGTEGVVRELKRGRHEVEMDERGETHDPQGDPSRSTWPFFTGSPFQVSSPCSTDCDVPRGHHDEPLRPGDDSDGIDLAAFGIMGDSREISESSIHPGAGAVESTAGSSAGSNIHFRNSVMNSGRDEPWRAPPKLLDCLGGCHAGLSTVERAPSILLQRYAYGICRLPVTVAAISIGIVHGIAEGCMIGIYALIGEEPLRVTLSRGCLAKSSLPTIVEHDEVPTPRRAG